MTALVLGTAAATAVAACTQTQSVPPIDAAVIDAAVDAIDAPLDAIDSGAVDGPLPPPDLPRSVA